LVFRRFCRRPSAFSEDSRALRIIVKSSRAWAACLSVSGRSGIIGKLAHVACVAVGNTTLDSTTLLNARLSGATAGSPALRGNAAARRKLLEPLALISEEFRASAQAGVVPLMR
jgi:hypothetical protein